MLFAAGSAFAVPDVVVDSDLQQFDKILAEKVKSKRITTEQAKEMGLNSAETYEVSSTIGAENLADNIANKLKDSAMPYYSISLDDPVGDDSGSYRALVTEYFGKVE